MENLTTKTGGSEDYRHQLPLQNHHITRKEDFMKLVSIQNISKTTCIPETTIRRYIQSFRDNLPQGTKLGRAWKYPVEMVDAVKMIHTEYQDGRLTIEIQEALSGVDANTFLKDNITTTLPPQVTSSLQEDIITLAVAIETLTQAITTLSPPYRQKPTTESHMTMNKRMNP